MWSLEEIQVALLLEIIAEHFRSASVAKAQAESFALIAKSGYHMVRIWSTFFMVLS